MRLGIIAEGAEDVVNRLGPWHPEHASPGVDLHPALHTAPELDRGMEGLPGTDAGETAERPRLRRASYTGLRRPGHLHPLPLKTGGWERLFALEGGCGGARALQMCAGHGWSVAQPAGGTGGWWPTETAPQLAQHTIAALGRPLPLGGNVPGGCVNHGALGADAPGVTGDDIAKVIGATVAGVVQLELARWWIRQPRPGARPRAPIDSTPSDDANRAVAELEDSTSCGNVGPPAALSVPARIDVATGDGGGSFELS